MNQRLTPAVTILVLNYNRAEDTIQCVESLQTCAYPSFRIVVIDNGSTDHSVELLKANIPEVPLVLTRTNLGYSGGMNAGIRRTQDQPTPYILLLNNDTVVEPDFLHHLVQALEEDKDAAAACGTIFSHHDRNLVWYAGGRLVRWRGLAIHEGKNRRLNVADLNGVRKVSFVTGCMMLLRTAALKDIGLFDERFFMYLDDIEFSARTRGKGYELLHVPRAVIHHRILGERDSAFKLYYSVRNRLLLTRLLDGFLVRTIAPLYFMTAIAAKLCYWRITNPGFFQAGWYGLADAFRGRFGRGRGHLFADS